MARRPKTTAHVVIRNTRAAHSGLTFEIIPGRPPPARLEPGSTSFRPGSGPASTSATSNGDTAVLRGKVVAPATYGVDVSQFEPRAEDAAAPAATPFPTSCSLWGSHALALRFRARGADGRRDGSASAFSCTSLGHGVHP